MSNLQVLSNKQVTIDSREVADMVGKEHSKLLRDIRVYCEYLNEAKIGLVDYFIESSYTDGKGEQRPCYVLTKMGCEMVANKLTGKKGILFTAKYTKKFNQMEQQLQQLTDSYMIQDPIERAKAWIMEQKEKQTLLLANRKKDQLIGELKPKADYTDRILKNKGLVTTTQIAKDYGMSAQEMNKLLHDLKIQYKQSGQWLLYSRYHNKGYTHSETVDIVRSDGTSDITMNTKWTQKGRLFLYNLLKSKNVLPIIEQTAQNEVAVGRET
ncbi:phage antirepressor KilAC domain-containing protein [Clostridium botulinum]|uniref:phage antirepressor KilAC domain-containing protein n=1 Tax=Clostridium botulinum TaxID=1491 RepID=UPI000A1723B1|nr:phage antirepressor KilAC domain-containing protein [Clostridium botulinum]OSA69856.1 hypothetical protein B2H90_00665 [Clostridium botulinum]OSA82674.1 hypothetical protein B2H84_07645 [Clostridium botulinum]